MGAMSDTIFDDELPRARLSLLLQHVSKLGDEREPSAVGGAAAGDLPWAPLARRKHEITAVQSS
jgi:hypothetical protein